MAKFILYILVAILTTWAMEGVNINAIFKKGQVVRKIDENRIIDELIEEIKRM